MATARATGGLASDAWAALIRASERPTPVAATSIDPLDYAPTDETIVPEELAPMLRHLAPAMLSARRTRVTTTPPEWPGRSATRPVLVGCADGVRRVLKGEHADGLPLRRRHIIADVIGATLAHAIQAPVPLFAIVETPQHVVDAHPAEIGHMRAGLCYGATYLGRCSDAHHRFVTPSGLSTRIRDELAAPPANRARLASIAVLHAWLHNKEAAALGADVEVIADESGVLWQVDFGAFLGNLPLGGQPGRTAIGPPDLDLIDCLHLTGEERREAVDCLAAGVTPEIIARAVASPPDEWRLPFDERIAIAEYIGQRRDQVLSRVGYELAEAS